MPANTFVNLPQNPEAGPLYVLLYDLVNTESDDQVFARQQLVKFIQDKPKGIRFAIFMLSDGLHLVQGFTSDKELLFAAIDLSRSHPHVAKIFLMGKNFGQNDPGTALLALKYLGGYLEGLPGRKNVIWLSGNFPVTLFPSDDESVDYIDESKKTLDLMARSQIAIYPVDVRGVAVENPHAPSGSTGGGGLTSDSREHAAADSNTPSAGTARAASSISPGAGGIGYNMLSGSYMTADEIASATGGRAFYSTNDVKAALTEATKNGASYYTLSYEPSNRNYDGKLRTIRVEMAQKGYALAYRRAYYDTESNGSPSLTAGPATPPSAEPKPQRLASDSLDANMRHGAPTAHELIFGAHVHAMGVPAMGTPEQMAQIAEESSLFKTGRHHSLPKPLRPVKLQKYTVDYTVMAHQLQRGGNTAPPSLELAVAAYDDDGRMLNAAVNLATEDDAHPGATRQSYRAEQEILAPAATATLRLAVRDTTTNRIGAMEVRLPLSPEPQPGEGAPDAAARPQ